MFSQVILIDQLSLLFKFPLSRYIFRTESLKRVSDNHEETLRESEEGGYSGKVTPVPIPNTVVKLTRADGTAWVTVWKSKSPPSSDSLFIYNN